MKIFLSFVIIIVCTGAYSQGHHADSLAQPGRSHSLSAEVVFPFGEFAETHGPGAGLRYEHFQGKTGRLSSLPAKKWGFIYGGAIGWQDGKKETPGLVYTYHYDDFFYGYMFGGAGFLPCRNGMISISSGPALSYYSATSRFNIYAGLNGSYYAWDKFGVGAGIRLLKESGAAPMAMGTFSAKYVF